jgi:2-polyprenyl-3-methyl-5-hydroxy-6-metoxy-1,4-benzoquinol methylase
MIEFLEKKMLAAELFLLLEKINKKPKAYEHYTTPELWCDPYISKQMLKYHLGEDVELASRKKNFIDRSSEWIADYFKIGKQFKICDFGCGPGLYTTRFAGKGAVITGVDFSQTSIDYARAQAKKHDLEIEYVLQDYLKFETDNQFDLITMIYCDFCALNPNQRAILLKKFHKYLKNNGSILLDVSSFAQYAAKQQMATYEYSKSDGFWSENPYYVFQNCFKYEQEHLLLDKFTIIEKSRMRENYNWLQCFSVETIKKELQQNGFELIDHFANVAGDPYKEDATEIAIVVKKI